MLTFLCPLEPAHSVTRRDREERGAGHVRGRLGLGGPVTVVTIS